MKLITLAINGIRHNLRNYTMYFIAMSFCVFTTYTFIALTMSESIEAKLNTSLNYQNTFIGFGIVIMFFVFFFLLSSNKSFIRYRKREISTYALFGMSNAKLAWLLFLDTLIVGAAALITGILLGIFFSKLMAMVLLKMVVADFGSDIRFSIDPLAIFVTAAVFFATFIIMGLSGRRTINKFQLVDLFKGEKVSEGKTRGSMAMLIISVILIALGYAGALQKEPGVIVALMIAVIGVVVAGTYLFFSGGLQKVLSLMKHNRKWLYKKSRLISVSLFSHKAKTMAGTMGTIAVLVAVSTTAIAFGYTIYRSAEGNTMDTCCFDVWYSSDDSSVSDDVHRILSENDLEILNEISFEKYVSHPETANTPSELTYFFDDEISVTTYSESTYNKIVSASLGSGTKADVQPGEAYVLYPNYSEDVRSKNFALSFAGRQMEPVLKKVANTYSFGSYLMTIVLDDSDFDELVSSGEIVPNDQDDLSYFTGINYEKALSDDTAAKSLSALLTLRSGSYRIAYEIYIEEMRLFGLLCFIGYFICAVFILMSASMLYFKQIVIGTEERKQYVMLRKIGMNTDEEKKVVRGRLVPVFFIPLIIGLMHSLFAMKAADTVIFSNFFVSTGPTYIRVLLASMVMYAVYIVIYTFFYLLTKSQYTKTIR